MCKVTKISIVTYHFQGLDENVPYWVCFLGIGGALIQFYLPRFTRDVWMGLRAYDRQLSCIKLDDILQ